MGTPPLSRQVAVRRPRRQKLLGMVGAACFVPLQSKRQLYLQPLTGLRPQFDDRYG